MKSILNKLKSVALETNRLSIRRLTMEDCEDIFNIFSDPEVTRFTGIATMENLVDAKDFIQLTIDGFEDGSLLEWGIVEKSTGELMGICCYHKWDEKNKHAEVGFAIGKKFWGKGFMTELLDVFIPFGFKELQLHRIEADVEPRNTASLKLLEKYNFKKEGVLRERYHKHGEIQDAMILGLLRHECA